MRDKRLARLPYESYTLAQASRLISRKPVPFPVILVTAVDAIFPPTRSMARYNAAMQGRAGTDPILGEKLA